MSKYRDRYFKDITVEKVPVPGSKRMRRVYLYHGDYWYWNKSPLEIRRHKILYGALYALNVLLYLAATIRDTGANREKYLSVPILLAAAALLYGLYSVIHFCTAGEELREFDFHEINTRLLGTAISSSVLQFAGALMSLCYGLFVQTSGDYFLLAAELALCGGCALTVFITHKKLGSVLVREGEGADRYKQRRYREEAEQEEKE